MTLVTMRADKVRVPFRRPFPWAQGMWVEREAWIIRLTDVDGRTGVGEAVLEPADGETASTVLDHLVHDVVGQVRDGQPPTDEALELHGSPGRALRAAIDSARFDLDGRPSPRITPGGDGVRVNATIASMGSDAMAEAARQALHAGYRTLKLKAGAERETEVLVERLRAVRAAVGPDVHLRVDANGAWDLDTATERLDAIARFALEYIEQPLAGDDAGELAELRRRVRVRIAADETVTSLRTARELLDAEAVDVLVVKPVRVGGPGPAAAIAALAAERGVPVVLSTLFETGVGLAAALAIAATLPDVPASRLGHRPDHGLATAGVLEHDLLLHPLVVEEGRMWTPDEPADGGLGIVLDERALARFLVESGGAPE